MDISRLARENELMKDYIHVNEILIDMILEKRRAIAILNHYEPISRKNGTVNIKKHLTTCVVERAI